MNARLNKNSANSSDWKLRREFPVEDLTAARYRWTLDQPAVQVRALVAAGDSLVVAGHPDFVDERRAFRLPDDPDVVEGLQRQAEALEGRHGGRLWVVSKRDGRPAARYRLDAPPVFDGMAAAAGRLFVSTMDGSVSCLAADGATALKKEEPDEPVQVISDEPAEPGYLKPPEVDKSGDFDRVSRCRVVASKLGYCLRPAGSKQTCFALQKQQAPLTGQVTLAAKLRVPGDEGFLVNGFLVFGDGPADERLVKCGIRFRTQKALIVQEPLGAGEKSKSAGVNVPVGTTVHLRVQVDLAKQKVVFTADGATIEADLERPLQSITHVGYCTDSAVAEFSPIEVARP